MSKTRNICFTLNNYTEDELSSIRRIGSESKYCVFQREVGASGTKHLQGYVCLENARAMSGWKRLLGRRAHLEFARGTAIQNLGYCTKEDSREPGTEPEIFGSIPQQGSRSDLGAVAERIRGGARMQDIAEEFPGDFVRYTNGIGKLQSIFGANRKWKTEVFWFYGPTGSGKSHAAREFDESAYWKMGSSKWWDGYDGQETVIVDDYRRDLCTFAELLRLFDEYPMRVEYKGGSCSFVARRVIITTPKSPRDTWDGRTEEDLQQLLRRIEHTRYFGEAPRAFVPGFTPGPQGVGALPEHSEADEEGEDGSGSD